MTEKMQEFLERANKAYFEGNPFITDAEFDLLARKYNFEVLGSLVASPEKGRHLFALYSLQKIYDDEARPFMGGVETPKLDGAAISLRYEEGHLVQALTRGDGKIGKDCTPQVIASGMVPHGIDTLDQIQISGEVLVHKDTENARNLASGSLGLLDLQEIRKRKLSFVAYSVQPNIYQNYIMDMAELHQYGFLTVMDGSNVLNLFPTDGTVYRLDNNEAFINAGYTAKHPKGAYAHKLSTDVAVEETILREVTWQVGSSGKVTPVAHFDEVVIDDAKITKSTLHNVGIIEELDLEIGDTVLVTRRGSVIPGIIGKL